MFDPKFKNLNLINKKNVDVIFNALHGKGGEDGIAQTYFEYLKIPYTHSGVISSHNSMNKIISKEIFLKKKIITPKFFTLNKKNFNAQRLKKNIIKKKITTPKFFVLNKKKFNDQKLKKNIIKKKNYISYRCKTSR